MQHYQSITNRKIRIAIVGCGRISKNHFGSIEKHGDELELHLVGHGHGAAVDLARGPPVLELAKALAEPAHVLGRVTEGAPNDLGVAVGQRALGHLPNQIGDGRGLIEHQNDALALVVQAGERFTLAEM